MRQTEINTKVDVLNEQLFEYETEIVEVKTGNDIAGELGPLKYLSGLTGIPMDKIINILLLTIIFVFDPLAIALVIAANFAFEKLKPKENIYGEKFVDGDLFEEGEKWSPQLELNFDDRIPGLENEIQSLKEEITDFKTKLSSVIMFDGLEEEPNLPQPPTEEEYVEAKMKDFRANMILGEFRRRRLENSLKQEYKKKKDNDEDLTITY